MPTIKVNTSQLSTLESDMQGILNRVNSIMERFNSASNNLDWDVKAESNISSRLSGISRELYAESRGISGMKSYLGTAWKKYAEVEQQNSGKKMKNEVSGRGYNVYVNKRSEKISNIHKLAGYDGSNYYWKAIEIEQLFKKQLSWIKGSYNFDVDQVEVDVAETSFTKGFWDVVSSFMAGNVSKKISNYDDTDEDNFARVLAGSASVCFKPGKYLQYSNDSAISDSINDLSEFLTDKNVIPKQEKKPVKQINPDESWYSKQGTIAEVKAEAKIEGSVLDVKATGKSEYAQGSIQVKGLTGEAHASANAGFYIYEKGPDGEVKRIISPSVSAEVGASVAVIDIDAEGRIGFGEDNNMLGLYGNTEVKAYSAEAKAKASWIPGKEVYAGASAEADLFKAEATGGVSVLGTDIGISGAVKVGVGAHAEIGYTDGKLKVDVGAAIGIGVDIGFEIDVSGTVDAVCGWAESVWDNIKWW